MVEEVVAVPRVELEAPPDPEGFTEAAAAEFQGERILVEELQAAIHLCKGRRRNLSSLYISKYLRHGLDY